MEYQELQVYNEHQPEDKCYMTQKYIVDMISHIKHEFTSECPCVAMDFKKKIFTSLQFQIFKKSHYAFYKTQ